MFLDVRYLLPLVVIQPSCILFSIRLVFSLDVYHIGFVCYDTWWRMFILDVAYWVYESGGIFRALSI